LTTATHNEAEPKARALPSRWWWQPVLAAFGLAFLGALVVGLAQGVRPFYADAEGYWALSQSFAYTGHFSLLNFVSPQRGYFLPLVIYGLRMFTEGTFQSESTAATVLIAVLFALIGAVFAPRLAEVAWPRQSWGFLRRIVLMALLLIFWCGNLNYPLTDFPGLAMGLLALVAVARFDSPGWMLLSGMAAAATLNLRPAYEPLVLMLLVIVGLGWFDQRHGKHASAARRVLCMSLLIAGFALVSLPQSLSAHRYFHSWNPIPGSSSALTEEVLTKGMSAQRWDSFERPVGTPNAIIYKDESGRRLLEQQPEKEVKTSGQYIGLILSHPTIMLPMIVRHVINGLDVRYSTIYVENLAGEGHLALRLAGFLVVFLALVRLLWSRARRSLGPVRWRYPIALALCCATSLPSAIETRYMLPIEVLAYILVLAPGWPNPIGPAEEGIRRFRTPALLGLAGLAFAAVVWHTVSTIPISLAYPV
jgi:NADH:ubiquinone oxidoreductase subunit 6 (subunit J)